MKQINGWHLPSKDGYFTRFVEGAAKKENGFQREHLALAMAHVKDFDIAIDVGAHVGFWTLDLAARFSEVYAFEPAPDTFECLIKNATGHDNVHCFNSAVGPYQGVCTVMDDPEPKRKGNTGARFVVADAGHTQMIALDDFGFRGCDLLKIDVEGFEPGVLRGALALIRAYRPIIIMETDKRFAGRYGFTKRAAVDFVLGLGYEEDEHLEPDNRPCKAGKFINAIRPDRIFIPL